MTIRLTELTAFETASSDAPALAEYPSATEYSGKNVAGSPFPPACKNAAPALKRNAGLSASFRSTCVGRLPMKRDGADVRATGSEMVKFNKASSRRVQRGPMAVKSARIRGEKTSPPTPAPERMKPMADPR